MEHSTLCDDLAEKRFSPFVYCLLIQATLYCQSVVRLKTSLYLIVYAVLFAVQLVCVTWTSYHALRQEALRVRSAVSKFSTNAC
jgi:hypothetical protein